MRGVMTIRKVPDNLKETEAWKRAEAENTARMEAIHGAVVAARLCPFCLHKVAMLTYGAYGPELVKCPGCGEVIAFPPVMIDGSGTTWRTLTVKEP